VLLNVLSFDERIVTALVVIAVAIDQGSNGWPGLRRAPAWDSFVAGFASRRPGGASDTGHVPGH
jgi:hypothetical protein